MPWDHNDLGIDLQRAKSLPICDACRKQSDGCQRCPDGTILCGTHYDEWLQKNWATYRLGKALTASDYASELRNGKFKRCWEATE